MFIQLGYPPDACHRIEFRQSIRKVREHLSSGSTRFFPLLLSYARMSRFAC